MHSDWPYHLLAAFGKATGKDSPKFWAKQFDGYEMHRQIREANVKDKFWRDRWERYQREGLEWEEGWPVMGAASVAKEVQLVEDF